MCTENNTNNQWIIKRTHSSTAQLETGTISQKKLYLHPLLNPSGTTSHHKLPPEYSTSTGERESCPFHEEPWHWHLHYVSSLSMHSALPTSVFIPGLPFSGRPGFPDFFIPYFPGMKTARFPGNREHRTAVAGAAL